MENEKKVLSTEETENNIKGNAPKDTLDALLLDADDEDFAVEEQDIRFDAFMAEYRDLISKNLSEAQNAKKAKVEQADDEDEEDESEFLISLPKKQTQKKAKPAAKSSDWDEEITLAPKEYEDPLDDNDPMHKDSVVEDEFEPDFDLGETVEEKEDKFQLSINFEGEKPDNIRETEENKSKYDPDNPRKIDWVFDIAEIFVFVLAAVMIVTTFFFKHAIVEGPSMSNTLAENDHLIISNLFYTPERGDIVVFEDYSLTDERLRKPIVKRVIGIPGDTVEIRLDSNGRVIAIVNDEQLPDEYALNTNDSVIDTSSFNSPIVLGKDEIFVMGDNRYHSVDSRDFGPIKTETVLGKVLIRFFPFDKFGTVE